MQERQAASRTQDRAIPLVVENHNKKYTVSEQALDILSQVEGSITVVVVCGAYRTGKSYLINRVLLGRSDGFGVGSTIDACTKGLWMWSKLLKCQDYLGAPTNLLIIDSEGLSSCEQDGTSDSNLFALSTLLSSMLVYNSVGAIDEGSIDCLAVVGQISKHLQSKAGGSEHAEADSPEFYWILRDFSLQLLSTSGQPLTENEYLENSLKSSKASSDDHNRIRKALTAFFPRRHCYTLVRPTTSESQLQNLDRVQLQRLRPQFVQQVLDLRRKLLSSLKPKRLNGKKLTGENLCGLLSSYVHAINRGLLPNIDNTWMQVCRSECQHALADCTVQFQNWVEEILGQLPLSEKQFGRAQKEVKRSILHMFSQRTAGNELAGEHMKQLKRVVKGRLQLLSDQNSKQLSKHCRQFLQRQFKHVQNKVEKGQLKSIEELMRQLDMFSEFLQTSYPFRGGLADRMFAVLLKDKLGHYSVELARRLQDVIEKLNGQMFQQKGQIKSLNTELAHLKEIQLGKCRQTIAELEAGLDLQRFQSMEFKMAIQALRQEAALAEQRTSRLEADKAQLKKQLQDSKLKVSLAQEERYTTRKELELLQAELETGRTLSDNQQRYFSQLKEEFLKKEKSQQSQIRRLQQQVEERVRELTTRMQTSNQRHMETIEQLETRLQSRNSDFGRIVEQRNQIESRYLTEISQKNQKIFVLNRELKEGKFKRASELEETVRSLQKELTTEQERSRKLKKELESKSHLTSELEQERNDLKLKVNDRSSRDILDKSMLNLQEANSKLENQARSLRESVELLQKREALLTQQYEVQLAELNQEIGNQQQSKKQLMLQLAQYDRTKDEGLLREYEGRLLELQSQLQKKSETLIEVKEHEREEYNVGITSIKDAYLKERQGLEAAHQQERKKFERELTTLRKGLAEKQEECQNLLQACEQDKLVLKKKNEEVVNLVEKLAAAQKQLLEQHQRRQDTQRQLDELKESSSQLQEKLTDQLTKNDQLRNRAMIGQSKFEQQKHQLLRLGKQNITLKGKTDSLQAELKRKKAIEEQRQQEQERNQLQQRYDELRTKYQRTCDEFMSVKSGLEKDLALNTQNVAQKVIQNEFIGRKYEDCRKELDKLNQHLEQTISTVSSYIESQHNNALQELKSQLDEKSSQLQILERKHEKLKKSLKELESSYLRQVSNLETEKGKLQQVLTSTMRRNEQLMAFHEQESIYSNSRMSCLQEKLHLTSDMQGLECDRLRKENEDIRAELQQLHQSQLEAKLDIEERLRGTIQTLERQLQQRRVLIERLQSQLAEQRSEKKQSRQECAQLEVKLKAAQRCEKRSRMERVSEGVLVEQIELLKKQRDEYINNSRRDYHQLNELMTKKLDQLQKKLQAEQASNKRLRMELDKQATCFNLSKENMNDRINQLTLTNELLSQQMESLKRSPALATSPRNKYRFRLQDFPSS